jgi:hypothetical protein
VDSEQILGRNLDFGILNMYIEDSSLRLCIFKLSSTTVLKSEIFTVKVLGKPWGIAMGVKF